MDQELTEDEPSLDVFLDVKVSDTVWGVQSMSVSMSQASQSGAAQTSGRLTNPNTRFANFSSNCIRKVSTTGAVTTLARLTIGGFDIGVFPSTDRDLAAPCCT
jgi:hypothetical protein